MTPPWGGPVDKIFVNARDLDDTVTLSTALPSELAGRDGNDTLNGGDGNDVLKGDDGDDTLNGNAGNDFLLGEDQASGEIGNDLLNGGDGSDVLSYASTSGVTVDLNDTGPQNTIGAGTDTLSTIERINGSAPWTTPCCRSPNEDRASAGNPKRACRGCAVSSLVTPDQLHPRRGLSMPTEIAGSDSCALAPQPKAKGHLCGGRR